MKTPCRCPFKGYKYGHRKPTETSVFQFFYKCMNSSLEELIKIKVIFILRQGMFRWQNLKKSVTFFTHIQLKSFPIRQLNAASCKSLEIRASFVTKRRILSNGKFVSIKVSRCCNTLYLMKVETQRITQFEFW